LTVAFVIDNSVVCGLVFANQSTAYTEAIAARLPDEQIHAPALWELECVNVLRTACLRERMIASEAQELLAKFEALPIEVDRSVVSRGELLALALRFGLTSYDASYLELALRLQLPIATKDGPLHGAALAAGVGVVKA
jgi:predicted nucleic acid-binding protein